MKSKLFALAAAVSLVFGAAATAGTLEPSLQHAMTQVDLGVDLPVIVQFAEQVDKAALRAEANRLAKALYPDNPKKRKKARRKLLRKMLVDALKDQAKDSKKQVKDFLKSHKENRKVKLLWARNGVVGDVPAYLLEELAAQPGVEEVKLDARVQGPGPSTPPTAPTYWNLPATGVQELWNLGHTGTGVVVATLDTGVDASHPDLGPKWRGGPNDWFDPHGEHASPADINGHGTQVMGLIVGGSAIYYQIGMAPDAQWIAAKIFDDSNQATLGGIHEAYQWVLDPDGNSATDDAPDIVNNSWDLANAVNQCNQEFAEDLALLTASDIATVFAGGNYGPNPETSVSPANDPAVLAVGGVDSALNIDVQSSRGPGACDGGVFPHLVAPGEAVLTADLVPIYYNFVSGTSFAVAHVAGGMAVLKGAFADASASQLRASLIDTTADLGAPGPDDTYGHGMIDLAAAYARLEAELGGSPGSLQFGAADYSVDEGVASLTVTVTRTGGSTGEVSVDYATSDGTAIADADYRVVPGTLTLLDGEVSGSFTVTILDDSLVEGDEAFSVTLTNAAGATLGSPTDAQVIIIDDDVLDGDGDGVSDALDLCPNTPAGETVDADGCSAGQLDADADGVIDALDQCPNTPAGEPVGADGCSASQLDSDGDGVSDALDGCPGTLVGTAVDAVGCPVGPVDADGDGFAADQDCNDGDATVYPGAPEIPHDGLDQDCNGVDLTIDVTRARYVVGQDKLVILATSSLNAGAGLRTTIGLQNGGTVDKPLNWNNSNSRWQKTLKPFSTNFGSAPNSVTVYGPEGEVTVSVELR
jgi:bacillopeptidase F